MLSPGSSNIFRPASTLSRKRALGSFYVLFYDWCRSAGSYNGSISNRGHMNIRSRGFTTLRRAAPTRETSNLATKNFSRSNTTSNTPSEPPLSSNLRRLMRSMPHSVVVATATQPSIEKGTPSQYKGMTLSSFTSLTLTPYPIVTFNIRKPSSTLSAIKESGQFLVHILSATTSGMNVAQAFARGNNDHAFFNPAFRVFAMKTRTGTDGPPLLAAEGISKVLRCEVLQEEQKGLIEVGDHTMVLAKVVSILEPRTDAEDASLQEHGLCYLDGQYRSVGAPIE